MAQTIITAQALTPEAFAPFGDILDFSNPADMLINQGKCERHHNLAHLQFTQSEAGKGEAGKGEAGISLFNAMPRSLPYELDMMERHPLGSQAFIPMTQNPFLVIVAEDDDGKPAIPQAFITTSSMGVNYHANIWHGVLTPLEAPGHFAVIDRIGSGENLQEYWFEEKYLINKD